MPRFTKDYISNNLLKLIYLLGFLILAFFILDSIKSDKAEDKLKLLEIVTVIGGGYYAASGVKEQIATKKCDKPCSNEQNDK